MHQCTNVSTGMTDTMGGIGGVGAAGTAGVKRPRFGTTFPHVKRNSDLRRKKKSQFNFAAGSETLYEGNRH